MHFIAQLVDKIFNIYALGLVVYTVLSWINNPNANKARTWLEKFYLPPFTFIQTNIKPINAGGKLIDFSPVILLVGIMIVRKIVGYLLI